MHADLHRRLIYLDRDYIADFYEVTTGESPSTTITKNQSKKAYPRTIHEPYSLKKFLRPCSIIPSTRCPDENSCRPQNNTVYNNSIARHPMHTGTAPCSPSHHPRNSTRLHMRVRARMPSPSSTTRVTPSKPCCTARLPSTSRRGWSWQARASLMAKATTTRRRSMSSRPFANTWSAASSPMALRVPAVMHAAMTFSSLFPAKVVESVHRATRGAWWRRRRT